MSAHEPDEVEKIDAWIAELEQRKAAELAKRGQTPNATDFTVKLRAQEEGASLFERMSLAERTELQRQDPEKFGEMLEQYRLNGMRRLFRGAL
jgi:hypothetical protein